MDLIKEIYCNDAYEPFLRYCEKRRYVQMKDLGRCSFADLGIYPGITATLLSRIKAVFMAYRKKHPDVLIGAAPRAKKPAARSSVSDPALEQRLKSYFAAHTDSLVRLTDLVKTGGAKRTDILKVLERASWCKPVDSSTFFYIPAE